MTKKVGKQRTADKRQAKATYTKDKALDTFTTAMTEVGKANALLAEANELDAGARATTVNRIEELREQLSTLQDRKAERDYQIQDNNELIGRLRKFTV